MKIIAVLSLLFCCLALWAADETVSERPDVRKEMELYLRIQPNPDDPVSPRDMLVEWQKKEKISDQEIYDVLADIINEVFRDPKRKNAPDDDLRFLGRRAITTLIYYHPDREKTSILLKDLIEKDYWGMSRLSALNAYLYINRANLLDDPIVEGILIAEQEVKSGERYQAFRELLLRYAETADPAEKERISECFYQLASTINDWNVSPLLDKFLVQQRPGYQNSVQRKNNLTRLMQKLESNNIRTKLYWDTRQSLETLSAID